MNLVRILFLIPALFLASIAWGATVPVASVGASDNVSVVLVTKPEFRAGLSFFKMLKRVLDNVPVSYQSVNDYKVMPEQASLVVVAGTGALEELLSSGRLKHPALAVLIAKNSFERLTRKFPVKHVSAIFQEPPLSRQISLARLIKPDIKTLGTLATLPVPSSDIDEIRRLSREQGLKLEIGKIKVDGGINRELARVLRNSDFLLGYYDTGLFGADNIKNILLTAYRSGKMLIGPTGAYVKAGSVASSKSSYGDFARQVEDVVVALAKGEGLPEAGYARYFSVVVNKRVARSLGIKLPDTETLMKSLRRVRPR